MAEDGVLVLAGATASGKTELAIELAREFDAEIVGADSRQIYRDMPIGTAAPTPSQLADVPHHLIGFLPPEERYSAARFAGDALDQIRAIHRRGRRAIVVGGTGFYIRALTGGVELAPQYDSLVRDRLAREAKIHPPGFLHGWLERLDPGRARVLEVNDAYRVLRALEISLARPAATLRDTAMPTLASEGLLSMQIFLDVPWSVIDERIARRTERMIAAGLIEEAEGVGGEAIAASAVGYAQAFAFLRGWCTRDETCASIKRATRRYARRQRAWFRSEPSTVWLAPEGVAAAVREKLGWTSKRE